MQFQKRIIKYTALIMCALMLTISVTDHCTITSYAAGSAQLTGEKVIDMALTKTGVIANSSFLQKVQASILNMLNGTVTSYSTYCKDNALERNEESWNQYLNSDSYSTLLLKPAAWALQSSYFLGWMFGEDYRSEIMESDYVQLLAETSTCTQGESYVIKDEVVEFVRDTFDDIVDNEGLGYYYIDVMKSSELPQDWYIDTSGYENAKKYIDSSNYETYITIICGASQYSHFWYYRNDMEYYLVKPYNDTSNSLLYIYDSYGNEIKTDYYTVSADNHTIDFYDSQTFHSNMRDYAFIKCEYFGKGDFKYLDEICCVFSKYGGRKIVYNSLQDLKDYCGGNKPVYHVTTNTYDASNDNSISYTGDYIINNGQNYSYDTLQNTIDNSVDNSTDESVNTIVNDSYNTIINNYYYTDPGSGDGGGSDDDSSGSGIGAIIDGIGSLLNFIVNLIGDVLSLIGSFLDTVYDMIKNLGGSFTNFSGLMGELFTFIPPDLMDLIEAGMGVAIVIVIWKMFKN